MSAFLQQAEDIMEVAVQGERGPDIAILVDRLGGIRMVDPDGWSLSALRAEFGADAAFRVERRGASVRVEGWDREQRCLIQRSASAFRFSDLPAACLPYCDLNTLSRPVNPDTRVEPASWLARAYKCEDDVVPRARALTVKAATG